MQGLGGLESDRDSGAGLRRRRRSSTSSQRRNARHMHVRQGRQRRVRKVLFYILLVFASAGMGYVVSHNEPRVSQSD